MKIRWLHPVVWLTDTRYLLAAIGVVMVSTAVYCEIKGAEPARKYASQATSPGSSVAGVKGLSGNDSLRVTNGVITPATNPKRGAVRLPASELASKRVARELPASEIPGKREVSKGPLEFKDIEFAGFSKFQAGKAGATRRAGATGGTGATRSGE